MTLANIPCFEDAISIKRFAFLHEKVKPLFEDPQMFEGFYKEYLAFTSNFNYGDWKPKVFIRDAILSPEHSFPAITCEYIKNILSDLSIKKEGYRINVSKHKDVGGTVLEIHGYKKNIRLSSHYNYDIYEGGYGTSKLLISIDPENGAFEVIDSTGTHIYAEIHYCHSFNKSLKMFVL